MQDILLKTFKFRVEPNTPLGRGNVAIGKIMKGEIICKMRGPIITLKEFSEKYDIDGCNPLQIGCDEFIDLVEPYVCFNHSCDPNSGIRNNGILFALKDIEPGDEILFDYSTTVDDLWWQMDCKCASSNCRKIIGDFQTIPHEKKEFYYQNNALTGYIKQLYY